MPTIHAIHPKGRGFITIKSGEEIILKIFTETGCREDPDGDCCIRLDPQISVPEDMQIDGDCVIWAQREDGELFVGQV